MIYVKPLRLLSWETAARLKSCLSPQPSEARLFNRVDVDLLSRNVTWTSSRDAQWGNFTNVMFYDGQGFMALRSSGFESAHDLDGASVCVTSGTTTELNLADFFRQNNMELSTVVFEDTASVYGAYEQGRCDAATSDKSQLAAIISGLSNPGDHMVLPETISKEPLTPVAPHGDDQWFDPGEDGHVRPHQRRGVGREPGQR